MDIRYFIILSLIVIATIIFLKMTKFIFKTIIIAGLILLILFSMYSGRIIEGAKEMIGISEPEIEINETINDIETLTDEVILNDQDLNNNENT